MSRAKDFVVKYDKAILTTFFTIIPAFIVSILFLPLWVDNYTFSQYINGKSTSYVDFNTMFSHMMLASLCLVVTMSFYNFFRRNVAKDEVFHLTRSYLTLNSVIVSTLLLIFVTGAFYISNGKLETENIKFIESKIVDVKNSIKDGSCTIANTKEGLMSVDVSACGTIKQNMPGKLYYSRGGHYNSTSIKLDGSPATYSSGFKEPTIMYKGYLGGFCRGLKNADSILYKEFASVEAHGENALSDDFKISWCEQYKNISQLEFILKK